MQNKKYTVVTLLCLSCLIFGSINLSAQRLGSKEDDKESETGLEHLKFSQRIVWGGTGGVAFGTDVTLIQISPRIGYRVTEKFIAGVGMRYEYYRQNPPGTASDFSASNYGGSIFGNYAISRGIFAHGEFEMINVEYYDESFELTRSWVEGLYVGGGFRQPLGGRAFVEIMALYNLTWRQISPAPSPLDIRIGFIII